jgi:hypothetical protein
MRFAVLLLVIGVTIIFWVQNRQPVALYFFGNSPQTALLTYQLSIAVWVLLAVAAGVFTSLVWQVLMALQKGSPSAASTPNTPPPRPPKSPGYPPREDSSRSPAFSPATKIQSNWEATDSDWGSYQDRPNIEQEDDWDIEAPPKEPTFPEKPTPTPPRETVERPLSQDTSTYFEIPQEPTNVSRTGSIYSYTYREESDRQRERRRDFQQPEERKEKVSEKETESNKIDRVYDVNYRVITPPYRDTSRQSPQEEDEEEWI